MPIYHLVCRDCGVVGRKLLQRTELETWLHQNRCCECEGVLERTATGPATEAVTRIDSPRAGDPIEVRDNIRELIADHKKHDA